jgi:hypothetical protein
MGRVSVIVRVIHGPVGTKPFDCESIVAEYVPKMYERSISARTRKLWRTGFTNDLELIPSGGCLSVIESSSCLTTFPASSLLPSLSIGTYAPRLSLVKNPCSFADILHRYDEESKEQFQTFHSAG